MTYTKDYDKIFCMMAKKYGLKKLLLKALAIRESSLNSEAYRFEPAFWDRYLVHNEEWKDEDPKIVSASWGLCQIMYVVAVENGFKKGRPPEDLCDPVVNIQLAAKILKRLMNKVIEKRYCDDFWWYSPIQIALARYNGGPGAGPDMGGVIREHPAEYALGVMEIWERLMKQEKECDDET